MFQFQFQCNTDWEGVWGFNDNAQELTAYFLSREIGNEEKAAEFFAKISKADDYWADIKPPVVGYRAGTTLVEVLPFMKVAGATDEEMRRFSARSLRLLPGAQEALQYIRSQMPTFIITTSYSAAAEAIAELVGIPSDNIYCTKVNINDYSFTSAEIKQIQRLRQEISGIPMLDWPSGASRPEELSGEMQKIAERMTQIFWGKDQGLMAMGSYQRMIKEVIVIGGPGKAEAILDSCEKTGNEVRNSMYLGDSITDEQALGLVRQHGGVAVSVNGNGYALRAAEFACLSAHTIVISVLVAAFQQGGREGVVWLINNWHHRGLKMSRIDERLISRLFSVYPDELPRLEQITEKNLTTLIPESERFRKEVRGRAGRLG